MRKLLFILTIWVSFSAYGQNPSDLKNYEKDFLDACNSDLQRNELNILFEKHTNLIFPQQGITQFLNGLDGVETGYSPLSAFKDEKAYKDNIDKLLHSKNAMHRILAYITIGSAADKSYDSILLDRLKTETEPGLTWAAMCLFYNHSKATDQLLDFMVEHEDFADTHFIDLYLELDKESLRATSWKNMNSNNKRAQVISIQTLAAIDKSQAADSLIIQATKTWDYAYKGYAIAALYQRYHIEKYEILKPFLENETTREVSILVLEGSRFQSDREMIERLKKIKKWD